ncbi:hypothetical protein ACJ77P_08235 [Syntrophus buswellii]|uniref:hypothetical protein n=1 Tax=Syntrophus buswellii TaxID=43774 RepID=UPI0038D513CD
MILSYRENLFGEKRARIKAKVTTDHPASSYGQPVIVLPDGGALDLVSWVGLGYQVEKATTKELAELEKVFGPLGE